MNLEAVLDVIGCKTRRDILALLTEEPRFVSEISQELEIGQKAIIGHLKAMEELGLINPTYQKIERGRPRKYYEISQGVEIKIFIKPDTIQMHMVGEEFTELHNIEERLIHGDKTAIDDLKILINKYKNAQKYAEDLLHQVENPEKQMSKTIITDITKTKAIPEFNTKS
ncbi:MAG: ArsR family transcriptional regulator [Methanosphaera stadtmanae]|jgi:ArsR family transcriptional regulator|nr:ArsR family transcriptional regulator [Methanosphaera stadtmanae]